MKQKKYQKRLAQLDIEKETRMTQLDEAVQFSRQARNSRNTTEETMSLDYELIAGAIARTRQVTQWIYKDTIKGRASRDAKLDALTLLATDVAATLGHAYPDFDKDRFLVATGLRT